MCQAYKYVVELKKLFNNISVEYDRLYLEIGKCDLAQQDLLHKIENSTFNAAQGYKLAKELKEVREKRRGYKNDFTIIEEVKNNFVKRYDQQLSKVFESATQKNNKLDQLTDKKVYVNRINDDGEIKKCHSYKSKKLLKLESKVKEQTA
jgi:hypothetical protein